MAGGGANTGMLANGIAERNWFVGVTPGISRNTVLLLGCIFLPYLSAQGQINRLQREYLVLPIDPKKAVLQKVKQVAFLD